MKKILFSAIIPRWNGWTDNYPLHIDQITMRDRLWIVVKPSIPDRDVIARHFFKAGKKRTQTFKTGKTLIQFHVQNEVYDAMLEKKENDKLAVEERCGRAAVPRDREIEPSMVADFTVGASMHLQRAELKMRHRLK